MKRQKKRIVRNSKKANKSQFDRIVHEAEGDINDFLNDNPLLKKKFMDHIAGGKTSE